MSENPFVGKWSYRSFLNDPDLAIPSDGKDPSFNPLLFGYGTLVIAETSPELLAGTIGGTGWSLKLHGSRAYGSPGLAQQHRNAATTGNRRFCNPHHSPSYRQGW